MPPVLSAVLDLLRCPVCGGALEEGEGVLRCGEGHSFDIARQGYVNLVPGPGDSAEMVEARDAFLAAGHFARLSAALADEARARRRRRERSWTSVPGPGITSRECSMLFRRRAA